MHDLVAPDKTPKPDHKFIKSTTTVNVKDIGWYIGLVLRKVNGKSSSSSGQWFLVSFESDEPASELLIDPELYWAPDESIEDKDAEPTTTGFLCAIEVATL